MGWEVHARRGQDGELTCRVWSTVSDCYITGTLSLEEARHFYMEGALEIPHHNARHNNWPAERLAEAIEEAMRHLDEFWEQAEHNLREFGMSHDYYGDELECVLDDDWREEL